MQIKKITNPARALQSHKYFKTGPGEYGFGDKFIGLSNPQMRAIAKQFKNLSFQNIQQLLRSQIHEHRFIGLIILTQKYKKQSQKKNEIFNFYLKNIQAVNNWDLVDLSAPNIIGAYLLQNQEKKYLLYQLAKSQVVWRRRISILSTFTFIRANKFDDTIKLAEIFLNDEHDLMHKGVGWMLRQIGKRDNNLLQNFIKKFYEQIPRTMLRYSIQKFPQNKRKKYLKGQF